MAQHTSPLSFGGALQDAHTASSSRSSEQVLSEAPKCGSGHMWDLGAHGGSAKAPARNIFRLAEARLVQHAPGGSMPSQTLKHCKIQSRRDAPKVAILEARAPKTRLVEAQCAHRKHCYLETPLSQDAMGGWKKEGGGKPHE